MAKLNPFLQGVVSALLILPLYGLTYFIPCCLLMCAAWGIEHGRTWQAVGAAFFAAGILGLRVEEQLKTLGKVDRTPTILDWGAVGNYLRRALRQEAMALGGTDLVGKVTSKDDMGILPPPEMFLTLKEVDEDAVLEQAQVLQEQEHKEEARRVAMHSWRNS